MRVAFVIMDIGLAGGAEHDIVHLSTGLKKAGHYPVVITSGGRLCKEMQAEGVTVELCPVKTRKARDLWRNGKLLADLVEKHDIEVLNPQGIYPAISGRWASRRLLRRGRTVPNIVTIHNLNSVAWWFYRMGGFLLNRMADHVIVESDCERLRLQNRGMKRPTTVIHNCFPPSKFARVTQSRDEIRREMAWPDEQVVFVMPARMSYEKNHCVLFDALKRPELQGLNFLCYLAGDGDMLEQNKALAVQMGVQDRVVFGGFRSDVPKLEKGADAYLLCSKHESLPLSIREAMLAGLPILSTRVGGVPEAVEDGKNGLLVPPGDAAALAAAMAKLAKDASLRRQMGLYGQQAFEEKFNYDNWIRRTVEVMSGIREDFARRHR